MKPGRVPPPGNTDDEVSALVETLHQTGQRLEELTGGELDSVVDRSGRMFLMRGVQEQLRQVEAARQAAILSALPAHIALLDAQGLIISVNEAWRHFGVENALHYPGHAVGINYLEICDKARGDHAAEAREVAAGIRSVLDGSAKNYSLEYPCHSAEEQRWFLMVVAPLPGEPPNGAVVMHLNITDRNLAEEAFRVLSLKTERRERMLSTALSAMSDFAQIYDREGRILFANQPLLDLYGRSIEEVTGRNFRDLGYPDDLAGRLQRQLREVFETKKNITDETAYESPAGVKSYYEYIFSPAVAADGSVEFVVGSTRDITERKRTEKELQRQQSELRVLFDLMPAMIWFKDTENRILRVNSRVADAAGMAVADIEGKPSAEVYPQDAGRFYADDLEVMRSGAAKLGYVESLGSPQGRQKWVQTDKVPYFDHDGRVIGIVVMAQDVTERKKAEQDLQRFRTAMDSSGDAIVLVDRASMRYVDVNQTLCDMVGYTRQEVIGMTPMDLFGAPRETLERDYDEAIGEKTGKSLIVEGHYRHKVGTLIPVETRRRALNTAGGWIIVGSARDITERKQAESRILYLNRVLAVLSHTNALIVRVRDRDELFRGACRIAVDDGGFRMAWIGLVDRGAQSIVPAASVGVDADILASIAQRCSLGKAGRPGDTMAARAVREKTVIAANDSLNEAGNVFAERHAAYGIRSTVFVPLVVADEAVGVLVLYAREIDFFHEEELKQLSELAGNIAFAIDHIEKESIRKQAEAKIVRLNRVYAVLSGINTLIVRVRGRDELFEGACRIAVEEGRFRIAWIGLVDRAGTTVSPVASAGSKPEHTAFLRDQIALAGGFPLADSLAAQVVREKKILYSNDTRRDPRIRFRSEHEDNGTRALAILPMLVAGEVIGVLFLYAEEAGFFDPAEMKLLTELVGDISFAVDHLGNRARLDYLAYHDTLTGLANRALFHERLEQTVVSAREQGRKFALVFLDIERFKTINDSLGREAGDALIKAVAERTAGRVDAGRLARFDADHFAVIIPDLQTDEEVARRIEQRMEDVFGPPFRIRDTDLRISAKFGIAMFPADGPDADTLFRNAEAALKKAKSGGDRYLFYTQAMNERVAEKLSLENQLRQALERDEFVLHYQPKVNLASGLLTGCEALIRWNDPRAGLVPPGRFIPILEETGLINEVGRWALHRAIDDYLRWRKAGLPAVRIAVNVSPMQLRDRGFVAEIGRKTGIDTDAAAGLELEITESLIMEDVKHSIASLQAIRAMGITIAIDDFGTGFSSLSYLAKLPVNALKIDRSFVVDMTAGPQGLALVATIINLAHSLKLTVVAEGVETEEQRRILHLLRCDEMQGYLFSKPVPVEIFEAKFLARPAAG